MNTLGKLFRFTTSGESHGPQITVIVDGVPPGITFDLEKVRLWLARRRPGQDDLTSQRSEQDLPELVSGVFRGKTTGAPITIIVANRDARSKDYDQLEWIPRPGHADYPAHIRYHGYRDFRGGGIFSGRLTVGHVVAGSVAEQILKKHHPELTVKAVIQEIGGEKDPTLFKKQIWEAKKKKDSVGGVIQVTASGVPPGWGEPIYLPVEGVISALIFTVPAVTAIEFGEGFRGARLHGSENNDPYRIVNGKIVQATNHCGGVLGGLTTGNPLTFRVAVKPTSSIGLPQATIDLKDKKNTTLMLSGRHDPCIVPRAVPVVEAATWIGLADLMLLHKSLSPPSPNDLSNIIGRTPR
ncbi:MAG: chorismate synthase [Candidatus Ranarchaeia archaeon]